MKYLSPLIMFCLLSFAAKAQIGSTAPDFTATDTHGETHHLYDYLEDGKVVVLDFFFTTCGPCQYYSPQVNLAYEKYGCNTADVIFMAVDWGDSNAEVLAYDEEYFIEYPSISGTQGGGNAIVNAYNISGFPTFYVIDSTKKIIDQIDPPTLQVFDFRFDQHGIPPAECNITAINEPTIAEPLLLYPNPVQGEKLKIDFPQPSTGEAMVTLYDLCGKVMDKKQIHLNGSSYQFSVATLHPGTYFMKITALKSGKTYSGIFVKN